VKSSGEGLEERHLGIVLEEGGRRGRSGERGSTLHGGLHVGGVVALARAALVVHLAGSLLASQLALGLGAHGGFLALPFAFRLFANRRANRGRGDASRVALSGSTNGLALGAAILLTHILGATNGANRLLAVNCAFGARSFLALHLAAGAFADRVADSGAHGVIALPSALRVALSLSFGRQNGGRA